MSKYWEPSWAKESIVVKGSTDPDVLKKQIEVGEGLGYPRLAERDSEPCANESGLIRMAVLGPDWTALVRGPNRAQAADLQQEVGRLAFYFICTRPAVKAIPDSVEMAERKLIVPMRIVSDGGDEIIYRNETELPDTVGTFSLKADGRVVVLAGQDGTNQEYDLGLVAQLLYAPKPFEPSIFDLKIHYIGRARGELRESCALDRLETHNKYQEMVEYVQENQPNRDVWIILGAGTTIETWGGAEAGTNVSQEAMQAGDRHAREVLRERDRIDLTEALLINYFKPEKNSHHREKLDLNTKLMKRCYESGLTGMHIVFSSLNLGVGTFTDGVQSSIFHSNRTCL